MAGLGLVLGGATVALLWSRPSRTSKEIAAEPAASTLSHSPERNSSLADQQIHDLERREPAEATTKPSEEPTPNLSVVESNESPPPQGQPIPLPQVGKRERTPAAVFEHKYQNFSPEAIAAAKDSVMAAYKEAQKMAFDSRRDAGLYEIQRIDPANPVQFQGTADDPLFRVYVPSNSNEQHIVVLPFDEYPELYEMKDECAWLIRKTK